MLRFQYQRGKLLKRSNNPCTSDEPKKNIRTTTSVEVSDLKVESSNLIKVLEACLRGDGGIFEQNCDGESF
jgi:hypothetical protein